jgi:hypothetical protein
MMSVVGTGRRIRFGEAAVLAGFVDKATVTEALVLQRDRDGIGESHKLLGMILHEMGAISNDQLIDTLKRMNGSSQVLRRL